MKLVVVFSLTACTALIGSLFTTPHTLSWYANLNKPFFMPPGWLFGPVWTVLYILIATSAFIVWYRADDTHLVNTSLSYWLIQLVLNALWTPLFFGARFPLIAFFDILVLLAAIIFTIRSFVKVSRLAAILLLPYIVWVTFAAGLNASICILNH